MRLCELFIERIKQVQPHVNAMAQDRFKEALEEAKQVDELLAEFRGGKKAESEFSQDQLDALNSPLLGIPISVKESIGVRGMRNSCGLWSRRDVAADEDAVVVRNVRRYGMIPICTTNIPECTLYWADCQNKVYGRSRNPYDFDRITGASSGGEGALIGSGASLLGIGSDIGGSLRIPAHYCGIYSHKPSPFLVNTVGNFPPIKEARLRMFAIGPMTRYASDLRPLLKCLLMDRDNPKQDTYYKHQPENIAELRNELVRKLDQSIQTNIDLTQLRIFYFNFNESSQLKGKQSVQVQQEILDAQQELIDHFSSKFSCQIEQLNLDKYLKKALITWQCMMTCGGTTDRETSFEEDELKKTFGIESMLLEMVKMPLGLSKHTKESLLILTMGSTLPRERSKAYVVCEKFEKFAAELKQEMEATLGELGVLLMPTMPTVAYKNNVSLLKTSDLRFSSLSNVLQLPVSHATIRLDKKHRLPFGISIMGRQYNDLLTLAVAEEVEQAFGGWTPPSALTEPISATTKAAQDATTANTTATATSDPINEKQQQHQHQAARGEIAAQ